MSPTLDHQDFILVLRLPWTQFREGQVVLVEHPQYQLIIKRIHTIKNHKILLIGDNPCSLSTEAMGWINQHQIIGQLCWHIPGTPN